MLRKHEGRSPDGAACGAIRENVAQTPGFSLAKRLHPGYNAEIKWWARNFS